MPSVMVFMFHVIHLMTEAQGPPLLPFIGSEYAPDVFI